MKDISLPDDVAAIAASQKNKERDYWLNKMSGQLVKCYFPYDYHKSGNRYTTALEHVEFPGELLAKLMRLSNNSDNRLFMIFAAVVNVLINKYTGLNDIIIGTPVLKQERDVKFINTLLALRNRIEPFMTFKEVLLQVKETVMKAYEHQNYPVKILLHKLNMTFSQTDFPLFDAAVLLENIHEKKHLQDIHLNLIFNFVRKDECVECIIRYNSSLYKKETIKAIINHLVRVVTDVLLEINKAISAVDMMSDEEKHQVLHDFNAAGGEYPKGKTVPELFERQAKLTPDVDAVIYLDKKLTYRALHKKSNQLARLLRQKGIKPGNIVAVVFDWSVDMIVAIMGVLKSGAAYLPIDPYYPRKRIKDILTDSNVALIVTQKEFVTFLGEVPAEVMVIESPGQTDNHTSESKDADEDHEMICTPSPDDLAYIIYTSGSTGKPKGIMVEHRSFIDFAAWAVEEYGHKPGYQVLLSNSYAFDGSVQQIFPTLISGGTLHLLETEVRLNVEAYLAYLKDNKINNIDEVPAVMKVIFEHTDLDENKELLPHLTCLSLGSEYVSIELARQCRKYLNHHGRIINGYGPAEASVETCTYHFDGCSDKEKSLIGKPRKNLRVYLLDQAQRLCPIGTPGEICVSGIGIARGYVNKPDLTNQRFVRNIFSGIPNDILFKTGDQGRWLVDGNIEFIGRVDDQVKIRGYRIELREIENCLLTHPLVNHVVLTARENKSGDKYLCAYVVSKEDMSEKEIKLFLSERVPDYMVPAHAVFLENIPLNPNGKVDKKALPEPGEEETAEDYVPPRSETEKMLVELWEQVLGVEKDRIGVYSNFFELGGHSLSATVLVARIHKELNFKLPIAKLFAVPTVRELANIIQGTKKDKYASIEPVEAKEYYVLSPAQKRMFILHRMSPTETPYNMPQFIPLDEADMEIDKNRLEQAFKQLIRRHETLRTSFEIKGEEPVQRIHRDVDFKIKYYDLTVGGRDENKIKENFVKPFDLSQIPMLRVGLMKTRNREYTLMVDMHHIVSDAISDSILVKEFLALYNNKPLPPLRLHYKDYARWQNDPQQQTALKQQEEYWLNLFTDEIPVLHLPTDYPRPFMQSFEGSYVSFTLTEKELHTLKYLAQEVNATLFMLILSLFTILLSKLSGQEDIIVGTPIAGRRHADLECIIGLFVNTLPLRNYPSGEKTFEDFLQEVKNHTLEAFEKQEYQFEDLVEKVSVRRDTSRNPIFDVMFNLVNQEEFTDESREMNEQDLYQHKKSTSKFDVTLTVGDLGEKLIFTIEYCVKLFKPGTINRIIEYFRKMLFLLSGDWQLKLSGIEIITEDEKQQILVQFNDTAHQYPVDKTIPELFEEQVNRTPDHTTIISTEHSAPGRAAALTYRELNEKSNQLAHLLRRKAVTPDTIIGIMVERSVQMIAAIYAVLKAGAAYLPIEPTYPEERIRFMLEDSDSQFLLTQESFVPKINFDAEIINIQDESLFPDHKDTENPGKINTPEHLVYMIYTSGSTGKPKGALVKIRGFVNLLHWYTTEFNINASDCVFLVAPISFDLAQKNLFASLINGGTLCLASPGLPDYHEWSHTIAREKVTIINSAPSVFYPLIEFNTGNQFIRLKSLRYVFLGGEPIQGDKLARWYHSPNCQCQLVNTYGPTECTDIATYFRVSKKDITESKNIPIGTPIYNVSLLVMDKYQQVLPIGVIGELCIGGTGLSKGYHKNAQLTAEKFIRTPNLPIKEVYRTGDLARWLEDGTIEFLGRVDTQVKVRGNRVELGEIEGRLLNHPAVKEVVVTANAIDSGDNYLCAYIVFTGTEARDNKKPPPQSTELRDFLSGELPDYMIPSYFVHLEQIPLTPSGKVNRNALPAPGFMVGEDYEAPRNEIEEKLTEIWSRVLAVKKDIIGINANFFELGGHSLKATTLTLKIHKEINVKLPLAEVFKTPTIRGLAEFILNAGQQRYASIEPAEKNEYYDLSSAQKRLYILQHLDLDNVNYNVSQVIPLPANIDIQQLERIFKTLIQRHESLRTSFKMVSEKPVQVVHGEVDFIIKDSETTEDNVQEKVKNFVKPFNLSQAPLLRVELLRVINTEPQEQLILIDSHHIITDGVSQSILKREFLSLYHGEDLPPLRVRYVDYSRWQNHEKQKGLIKQQELYWLKEFSHEVPVLNLPIDYPRPVIQSFEGRVTDFVLDKKESRMIRDLVKETGATLYMVILSVFTILLSKLCSQEDIVVGTPIAGRRHADLENIIGIFVNSLPMRNFPRGVQRFKGFLGEVKKRTLTAYENQDYQLEDLVDKTSVRRDASRNPIFDVMFNLLNQEEHNRDISEITINQKGMSEHVKTTALFDINLTAMEVGEALLFSFEYCSRLFKTDTIEKFITYFRKILFLLSHDSDQEISTIELITKEEKQQILSDFNDTRAGYPQDETIPGLFAEQVERNPDHIAAVAPGHKKTGMEVTSGLTPSSDSISVTYRELNRRSNQLARKLKRKGVGADIIVGLRGDRSVEMIIGALGIIKAGGAYLPIDPSYPQERLCFILNDSNTRLLLDCEVIPTGIIDSKNAAIDGEIIDLYNKSLYHDESGEIEIEELESTCKPGDLLYVIYTSGSTGEPKGVLIHHQGVVNILHHLELSYPLEREDAYLLKTNYTFDVSVTELFGWFFGKGRLVILGINEEKDPPAIIETIRRHRVTHINVVPSMLKFFLDSLDEDIKKNLKSLKYIFVAGEAFSETLVKKITQLGLSVKFENIYGPTEATIYTTGFSLDSHTWDVFKEPPIGKPLSNCRVYIIDEYGKLLPPGIAGELCISGDGIARGYLNNLELTVERFIENPFEEGERLYKTGDLARWLWDGNIEYLGRMDHQVKIRGFRIELGEIESQLLSHERVKNAVVLVKSDETGDSYLCAYIVSREEIAVSVLREYLSWRLPDYMIPLYFVLLETLPLTPSGKVDRPSLFNINPEFKPGEDYAAPGNEIEIKLVEIWSGLLGIEKEIISIDANFFELGGHSLKATAMIAKIHKEFNIKITLGEIFKNPTIRAVSSFISAADSIIHQNVDMHQKHEEIII